MDPLFPTYSDKFDWDNNEAFDHADSNLTRYVIQQHSRIGPQIYANRYLPGISANYGTISLASVDGLADRLGTLVNIPRDYECRMLNPVAETVYTKTGQITNGRNDRRGWRLTFATPDTFNIGGRQVTFTGQSGLWWSGGSMRFSWNQPAELNYPVNWRDYVVEIVMVQGANSIRVELPGYTIPRVNPEQLRRGGTTAAGLTNWRHFLTAPNEERLRPSNFAAGTWHYVFRIYYRPVIARFRTERPKLRLNQTTQVLQFPLRGFLFEHLDKPVNEPTQGNPDLFIQRPRGRSIFDELRFVADRLNIRPSDKLRQATDGVVLASYQTPDNYRDWLDGLRTVGGLYSVHENRWGELDYLSLTEAGAPIDTTKFNRRLDGFDIEEPPIDRQLVFVGQWNDSSGEFFSTQTNAVYQTDARFTTSSNGFYRVSGGADEALPDGEVIT